MHVLVLNYGSGSDIGKRHALKYILETELTELQGQLLGRGRC